MFEIIWSVRARNVLKKTIEFWIEHNQSKEYSQKIAEEIVKKEDLLKANPYLGEETSFSGIRRILILKNFSIFYQINELNKKIKIVAFRDNHRKPKSYKS